MPPAGPRNRSGSPAQVQGPEPQVHVLRPLPVPPPPGLAGQCGDSGVQVGVVPPSKASWNAAPSHFRQETAVLSLWRRPCHSSGGMPLIRARACRMAVPWLNTATVWSGWAAAMRRRAPLHPLPQFPQPLSTGGRPSGVAAVEAVQLPGLGAAHLAPGLVLPVPHVQLPQLRVGTQFQAPGLIDSPGRGAGAVQVAGPHRVEVLPLEALLQAWICLRPFSVTRASYQPWMRRYRFPSASAWRIR